MAEKHWIQGAIKHPGSLHRALGIPEGQKIPRSTLERAAKRKGKVGRKARFALELEGFHHAAHKLYGGKK